MRSDQPLVRASVLIGGDELFSPASFSPASVRIELKEFCKVLEGLTSGCIMEKRRVSLLSG